jgi:hypothetical protein
MWGVKVLQGISEIEAADLCNSPIAIMKTDYKGHEIHVSAFCVSDRLVFHDFSQ